MLIVLELTVKLLLFKMLGSKTSLAFQLAYDFVCLLKLVYTFVLFLNRLRTSQNIADFFLKKNLLNFFSFFAANYDFVELLS